MDKKLLDILVCPASGAALEILDASSRDKFNEQIGSGDLYYNDGSKVDSPLEEGLRTVDGHTVYRIDNGIPVMLPDRGIVCDAAAKS